MRAHRRAPGRRSRRAARLSSPGRSSSPAICASAARPSMISAIAAAASSLVRSSRRDQLARSAAGNIRSVQPASRENSAESGGPRRSGSTRDETARRAPASVRCRRPMIVPSSLRPRRHLELGRQVLRRRPRASDSGRRRNGAVSPLKTPRPSCSIVEVLPCIGTRADDRAAEDARRWPDAPGTRQGSASAAPAAESRPS